MLGLPAPYRTPGQTCLTDIELVYAVFSFLVKSNILVTAFRLGVFLYKALEILKNNRVYRELRNL